MAPEIITSRDIGQAIKSHRKRLGLSQEQLAEMVGVSYQQLQRYESGYSLLNVENVQRIANALQLPLHKLFMYKREEEQLIDAVAPYFSNDEKTLLRYFRDLSAKADRQAVLRVIRKMTKK